MNCLDLNVECGPLVAHWMIQCSFEWGVKLPYLVKSSHWCHGLVKAGKIVLTKIQ